MQLAYNQSFRATGLIMCAWRKSRYSGILCVWYSLPLLHVYTHASRITTSTCSMSNSSDMDENSLVSRPFCPHTYIYARLFLITPKSGKSGRFGDVMVMSRMWTILRFLAVSSTKRGIESKQKLEQGLVGSFSWPSESSQRVPGSLAPSEGSPHKKRWVCQCLKLTKDRSLPFQGFERRLALFGA